MMFIKMLHKCL